MFLLHFIGRFFLVLPLLYFQGLQTGEEGDSAGYDIEKYPFTPGERLYYKMNYSIFTIGKAEIQINPYQYTIASEPCYKIEIFGRTAGAGAIVSTVNDTWGAYLKKDDLLPLITWRDLEEGRYKRKEYVDYDHKNKKIKVKAVNNSTGRYEGPKIYDYDAPAMMDLISGYAFLRTVDFNRFHLGDTIRINGFLEDKFYNFKILYEGTEEIKTKLGLIKAYKLVPVMPNNKLFAGENSITAWFAADKSRIPVKVIANMFIGKAGCEITGYEGMKEQPEFVEEN